MNENILEIKQFTGQGYRPLIVFGTWRVAILRWLPSIEPEKIDYMERHTQTDEVFVLLGGQATLILGGNSPKVDRLQSQKMEPGKLYNVKQDVWHTVLLNQDASVLIVEENNTGEENTEYFILTKEIRDEIVDFGAGL